MMDGHEQKLLEILRSYGGPVLVAFSGGVDSSVAAVAARRALGDDALAVTARSESNTDDDVALCEEIARGHGLRHEVIRYSELAIPNYSENPANRCYHCKSALYDRLGELARERGFAVVCDGSILEDGEDYRPGLKAVRERGVRSPLQEAGLTKADVRALAREWGLPNHDRPAAPCLSSRIPYGTRITEDKLTQVALAEKYLRGLGVKGALRCRHHGDVARLEVAPEEFETVLASRGRILEEFRRLGFRWVSLDLGGFQSGALNAVLSPEEKARHTLISEEDATA